MNNGKKWLDMLEYVEHPIFRSFLMSKKENNQSNGKTQSRHLHSMNAAYYSTNVDRWAIIVGISKYKHKSLNLKYADRDAEELYKLLQTPSGGGFEGDHIKKLINEEATTSEITKALRSFLKKPAKEDIVLLYFACHGSPDLDRPNIVYLLTHDTDPEDISGTALPMREIDLSLRENLHAERVVIIADTCHSAAIGGAIVRRGTGNDAQAINAYLQEVSKAKGGVALLTSAEANESAQESDQWSNGHGVFTHFLLQGMRGDADGYGQPKDGVVTVGELFDYVCEGVKKATNHQQHPTPGPNSYDRNLPMAITGGINAQEHYQLGCRLCDLGWLLDDTKRFQAAVEQFNEAIRLSRMAKTPFPRAELGLGQALVALGEHKGAISILSGFIERYKDETMNEALFLSGIAQANSLDYPSAVSTFEKFLAQYPDDDNSMWVRDYIGWLKSKTISRKYGLLIGINKYISSDIPPLAGCLNDTRIMEKILMQRYGFEENNMFTLLDNNATRQGILNAFKSLSQKATVDDTVLVYYSGHSIPESRRDAFKVKPEHNLYLVVHDTTNESGSMSNGISHSELHQMMNAIPSINKTLIMDTHPSIQFNEMVEKDGSYTLLLATDSAEIAYESQFEIEGKIIQAGLFTSVLFRQLEESQSNSITYGQLLDASIAKIRALGFNQTPLLIGDREQLIFEKEIYMNLFKFARRRSYNSYTNETLEKNYSLYRKKVTAPYARMHYSFGRAFLEKGNHAAAINALQTALQQCKGNNPEALIALGRAQVSMGLYAEALASFKKYAEAAPEEMTASVRILIERTEKLIFGPKHALLIGINDYLNPELTRVQGAVNDVLLLKDVLLTKFGFQEKDIKVLLNGDATRAAILENFKQIVDGAREGPALFYFAGNGSLNAVKAPTIVSVDGRQEHVYDIEIEELAELAANNASNMVTIVDAGSNLRFNKAVLGNRQIDVDLRKREATRDISIVTRFDRYKLNMGFLSIYSHSFSDVSSSSSIESELESKFEEKRSGAKGQFFGNLTYALVQSLAEVDVRSLTYSQWLASVSEQLKSERPVVLGDHRDERIFDNRTLRSEVLELATRIYQEPVFETIRLLLRMIEQREQLGDPYPEGKLNLGIAYAAIGEYNKSIFALESAIALYSDTEIMAYEKERDPNAQGHYHDAYYQIGRILFEKGGNFTKAVSELNEAIRLDPENTHAYYYLGEAIRKMVDSETLTKAEDALKTYLARGAPMGHENEVRLFLGSRTMKTSVR